MTSTTSSGTKERWVIPPTCPRCEAAGTVELNEIRSGGKEAKLKCSTCLRAWTIEPTPIWEVAGSYEERFKGLQRSVWVFLEAVDTKKSPQELNAMLDDLEEKSEWRR